MMTALMQIPENIGWMILGSLGTLNVIMGWKTGRLIYLAIKGRLEDRKEEVEE
jgi:hypothetical protein